MTLFSESSAKRLGLVIDGLIVTAVLVALAAYFGRVIRSQPPSHGLKDIARAARDSASDARSAFLAMVGDGHWLGPEDAPAVVMVYSSYGCGFCRSLDASIQEIQAKYPHHVAFVIKTVLAGPGDDLAPISLAAECAADEDRFESFHHAAMQIPRPEFTSSWRDVAVAVGLDRSAAFARCMRTQTHLDRLLANWAEAMELGLTGTPGIVVPGRVALGEPSMAELDALVAAQFRRPRW